MICSPFQTSLDDQVTLGERGVTCDKDGGEEKYVQCFGGGI